MHRIGIIGDLHAEHERLELALEYLNGVGVDAITARVTSPMAEAT